MTTPATLLTLSLPASTLLGIDLLATTSSTRFIGITHLPPGWHFLFTSPTAELSVRHGFWFHVDNDGYSGKRKTKRQKQVDLGMKRDDQEKNDEVVEKQGNGWLQISKWDPEVEQLVPFTDTTEITTWRHRLRSDPKLREGLFPYRQSVPQPTNTTNAKDSPSTPKPKSSSGNDFHEEPSDWPSLTAHITTPILERFTSTAKLALSSTSCAVQDTESIPGLTTTEAAGLNGYGGEKALGFLGIDLSRTWREGAVGRERTEGARDRSWALGDLVARLLRDGEREAVRDGEDGDEWGAEVLGEMEVAFLMVLTLSNYSCLEEWKRILALVLTCRAAVPEREGFFVAFLELLLLQLKHCADVEGGLFDMHDDGGGNFLRELLKGFRRGVDEVISSDVDDTGSDGGKNGQEVEEALEQVEAWVKKEWGWEMGDDWLRKGGLVLEDGEWLEVETEEMLGEDERGEFAPTVVDLGEGNTEARLGSEL